MAEKKKQIYEYCTEEEKVLSEFWRAVFIAKICNIQIPDDVEIKVITDNEMSEIAEEPYSDALAHLLIMYGAGFFSFENLADIAGDAARYKDEIYAAESFIIKQSGSDEEERVSEHIIQNILLCTINSKKYPEIQPVSFETARSLCDSTHTVIRNGFVFVKDVNFMSLLQDVGEPLGRFWKDGIKVVTIDQVIGEFKDNKSIEEKLDPKKTGNIMPCAEESEALKSDNLDNDVMPDMPFVLNIKNVFYIHRIYDKPYAVQFIHYAKENGIPFDENFESEYTEYIRKNKRQFTVSAISRKRDICENKINWFDYGTTKYADKQIIIDSKFDITEHIDISNDVPDDREISDDELVELAAEKFLENKKLPDRSVIEITFCGKKVLYLLVGGKLDRTLESDNFRRIPFDYNNVWTTVMEWSRSKLIQKKGDSIFVPASEMQKLPENDREYAKRMIEEQYSLKKGSNKMLQKLSELKSYAKKEFDIKAQQKALKDNAKREFGITEEDKK